MHKYSEKTEQRLNKLFSECTPECKSWKRKVSPKKFDSIWWRKTKKFWFLFLTEPVLIFSFSMIFPVWLFVFGVDFVDFSWENPLDSTTFGFRSVGKSISSSAWAKERTKSLRIVDRSINSSYFPSSTISPFAMTRIRSALLKWETPWVTQSLVYKCFIEKTKKNFFFVPKRTFSLRKPFEPKTFLKIWEPTWASTADSGSSSR